MIGSQLAHRCVPLLKYYICGSSPQYLSQCAQLWLLLQAGIPRVYGQQNQVCNLCTASKCGLVQLMFVLTYLVIMQAVHAHQRWCDAMSYPRVDRKSCYSMMQGRAGDCTYNALDCAMHRCELYCTVTMIVHPQSDAPSALGEPWPYFA